MKEKWEELYSEKELKSIQHIEKQILNEFIRVCNVLKIEFFVYGGTLLGLIKYGDMIPWDDDIDVAMTRENYTKFLEEAPNVLRENFTIQSPYNEKKSPYSYTKLRMKGTKFIEKFHHRLNIEKGIYIDIYPVDNIPDNEKLRLKQWKKSQLFCKLYYLRQCKHASFKNDSFFRVFKHTLLYYTLRLMPQRFYYKRIDKYMTMYDSIKTKRMACLFSPNYENIYVQLYPLKKKKLGDIEVNIPFCYDDHLKKRYGNYTKDIPNNKRFGHIPYEFYIPDYILKKEDI